MWNGHLGVRFLLTFILYGDKIKAEVNAMRIMFVCHGNICRSPMAEFILKDIINEKGLSENFFISSSCGYSIKVRGICVW